MKVYSWKTLAATIIIGLGMFISSLIKGDNFSLLYILFWGTLIVKGLSASLTKEGFEMDLRRTDINKKVTEKLFGQWALPVKFAGLFLIILAGIMIKILPSQRWLALFLFIGGLLYNLLVAMLMRKHIKKEERNYF